LEDGKKIVKGEREEIRQLLEIREGRELQERNRRRQF